MVNLHLVDCSATLHNGCSVGRSRSYDCCGFPTGGIYETLRLLNRRDIDLSRDVFCFIFDRKSFRKDLSTAYKGNRKRATKRFKRQAQLLEQMVDKMGFNNFAIDGLESDDIIYSICHKYKNNPNVGKIVIYGTDRDLAVNVSTKCTLRSTSSLVPDVNMQNFPYAFSDTEVVPFNSTLLYKTLRADRSDGLGVIASPQEFTTIVNKLGKLFPLANLADVNFMDNIIQRLSGTPEEMQAINERWNIVRPQLVDIEVNLTNNLDKTNCKFYCDMLFLKTIAKKLGVPYEACITKKWRDKLTQLAQEIRLEDIELGMKEQEVYIPKDLKIVEDLSDFI